MALTGEDEAYLQAHYPGRWKLQTETTGFQLLLLEGFVLPTGYTPDTATLMLRVPPDYPMGALDMFYFDPAVARTDGTAIGAVGNENHGGRTWQRWSRHDREAWQPGFHGVATHIARMENTMRTEMGQAS